MKKITIIILLVVCIVNTYAQDSNKVKSDIFAYDTYQWCIDINSLGGLFYQKATNVSLSNSYLNSVTSNISDLQNFAGRSFGLEGKVGYFFGKQQNNGVGIGITYLYQKSTIQVLNFSVEYQSFDRNNETFRQVISANHVIKEAVNTSNINIPLVYKYKRQLNKKFGFTADAGLLLNFVVQNSYNTNATFDYEAIYKYSMETGSPVAVFDNALTIGNQDVLFTKKHIKVNTVKEFTKLQQQGYNVGINVKPKNAVGITNYNAGSVGLIFEPAMSYGITDRISLNFGGLFIYQKINSTPDKNYQITDKVGVYNSLTRAISSNIEQTYGANIGLRYFFGKLKDSDHDGIPDRKDRCPLDSGLLKYCGCPDFDKDGIPDVDDSCPHEAGLVKYNGCPDTDGDGIPDKDDLCPNLFGSKNFHGCPDTDGDGIPDNEDLCPRQQGFSKFKGCPDSDGDGIPDNVDDCPFVAGIAKYNGCPVEQDSLNLAPRGGGGEKSNYASSYSEHYRKSIRKKELERKQIRFEFNKFSIKKSALEYLESVLKLMKENPDAVLTIEGYSDNVGTSSANIRISKERALAVKRFMIKKGINPERLRARGYGYRKPIASNNSSIGRAQNRRALMVVKSNTMQTNNSKPINSSAISVFPNEEQGSFTILLKTNFEENAVVTITNSAGKTVRQFNITANKPTEFTLDEPAGLYSFSAETATTKYEAKIIIAQ